jgi:hypothetical protein
MNPIFLDHNIFIFIFSETIVWIVLFFSVPILISLLRSWDFSSYSQLQFRLERNAYLVTSITLFVFILKLLLFPYFIFTIDKLSAIVPGAMCAAGVISFDPSGMQLLYLKITILFLLVLWLVVNYYDFKDKNYRWSILKFRIFVIIFILISIELYLTYYFFNTLDIHAVLNCCATLYGLLEGMNPLPFGLERSLLVILFYLIWLFILFSHKANQNLRHLAGLILFGIIAYFSVLYYFGTYIYALPGHNCPFCMFQSDYYYIGYVVWGSLAGALFSGVSALFVEIYMKVEARRLKNISSFLLSLFVVICTLYLFSYVYFNGSFLQEEVSNGMIMPM